MECKQKDWFGPQRFYLGIDVGRPFLRAVDLKPGGTIAISRRQDRCQEDVEVLLGEAGEGALVNCGPEEQHRLAYRAQVVREKDRCRIPSGKAMKYAWEMFPGTAKSDRTDTEAIAQMGIGGRTAIRPIAETDDLSTCVSLVSLQLLYATRRACPQQTPCGAS